MVKAKTPVDVGSLVRARRKQLGMDQSQLAEKIGVSRQWIIEIEKGKPGAELGLVLRALQALGLRVDVAAPGEAGPARQEASPERGAKPVAKLPVVKLASIIDRLSRPPAKSKQ